MHPHRYVAFAAGHHELDVHTGRVVALVIARLLGQRAGIGEVADERDGMRITGLDVVRTPRPLPDRDLRVPECRRHTHVDGVCAVLLEGDGLDAVASADSDRVLAVDQALALEVRGEHTYAVTAHLAHGAVGVSVVHEPDGPVVDTERGRAYDPQHAVGADAATPVTQRLDEVAVEITVDARVGVGQD